MTKAEIINKLVAGGSSRDRATIYADAFLEYREATENIEKNGVIVQHPRDGEPRTREPIYSALFATAR